MNTTLNKLILYLKYYFKLFIIIHYIYVSIFRTCFMDTSHLILGADTNRQRKKNCGWIHGNSMNFKKHVISLKQIKNEDNSQSYIIQTLCSTSTWFWLYINVFLFQKTILWSNLISILNKEKKIIARYFESKLFYDVNIHNIVIFDINFRTFFFQ